MTTKLCNHCKKEKDITDFYKRKSSIDWHHINDMLIVPIPKKIHSICSHNNRDEHRNKCNVWIYQLYGIDVSKLLCKRS